MSFAGLHANVIEKQVACFLGEEELAIQGKVNSKDIMSNSLFENLIERKRELQRASTAYTESLTGSNNLEV